MYAHKSILFAAAMSILLFAGCGTLFHGKQELEIIGPPNLQVETAGGGTLASYQSGTGLVTYPDPATTDSIRILYGTHSRTVALAKNPSGIELVNLLTYGIGFPIDDLSHSWFTYAPVYISVDSSASGVNGITATSTNWLGDSPGGRSLHALLLFGIGFAFQLNDNNGIPLPVGIEQISYPLVTFQGGVGIDYKKSWELFYLFRNDPSYALSNNSGETTGIATGDICLRYFFQKNLFLQGSYGKGYSTGYFTDFSTTPSFPEVGAAIGYAGDISYLSLQYFDGLSTFNVPEFQNVRYHTIYLNFGLNFPL